MGITYQVIDVEGPVAAVSSMNDGGHDGGVLHDKELGFAMRQTPLKLVGCIELKRENRTFSVGLPQDDVENVQRMMALKREETGSVIFHRSRHATQRRSPGCKGPKISTWTHDLRVHERVGHEKIHIDASQHTRVGHQRSCWMGCSSRVIKNRVFNFLCCLFMIFSTVAVMAMQSTKDSSVESCNCGADVGNVGTR